MKEQEFLSKRGNIVNEGVPQTLMRSGAQ